MAVDLGPVSQNLIYTPTPACNSLPQLSRDQNFLQGSIFKNLYSPGTAHYCHVPPAYNSMMFWPSQGGNPGSDYELDWQCGPKKTWFCP